MFAFVSNIFASKSTQTPNKNIEKAIHAKAEAQKSQAVSTEAGRYATEPRMQLEDDKPRPKRYPVTWLNTISYKRAQEALQKSHFNEAVRGERRHMILVQSKLNELSLAAHKNLKNRGIHPLDSKFDHSSKFTAKLSSQLKKNPVARNARMARANEFREEQQRELDSISSERKRHSKTERTRKALEAKFSIDDKPARSNAFEADFEAFSAKRNQFDKAKHTLEEALLGKKAQDPALKAELDSVKSYRAGFNRAEFEMQLRGALKGEKNPHARKMNIHHTFATVAELSSKHKHHVEGLNFKPSTP